MADPGAPRAEPEPDNRSVYIYDCRPESRESSEREIEISGKDFTQFLQAVRKEFSITRKDAFVLTTTDRREINKDIYGELANGKTLHLLQSVDQELTKATQERINYLPHYHTIVQSGQYEYYASEGQKALPYAFAELIDNALSATSRNPGVRRIDIRLLFDESQGGPAVVVMDNGRGMTSKELNNWAVYRLSKFNRENSTFQSDHSGYVRPTPVPRSLNSDISYFGVGGKQAVFYIGQSVRIISKPVGSPDVHEFVMSKEDFERKEKNKEEIYSGIIRNRKPGDCSHVKVDEERFLQSLILEEEGKDSFTAIVINRIQPEHVTYLRNDFILWTRELAHIYHYYVHGIHGNDLKNEKKADSPSNIDIQICLLERSPRLPKLINLREIDKDMQTLYINSSVAEFEFKASKGSDARVEGLIRYHPFLYDKETYPEDPYNSTPENDDDDCFIFQAEGRGKRPIFECFWNGRLIPYSSVNEFEWCAKPKKMCTVPLECYNRISGVLFANDCFQVSTNKLTFMDLELQLRDKETIFTRVLNSQEQRVKISREFTIWLKECHERFDKQVCVCVCVCVYLCFCLPSCSVSGPIQVHILNKKGETMSRLPVSNINAKKLLMELKVIWHSPKGDVQTNSHICMHSTKWEFWFKVMENLNKLGKYTLCLQTLLSDSESASEWAGKRLPQYVLHFTIKGNLSFFMKLKFFSVIFVGVPFSLNLEFKDEFDHVTQPPSDIKPQLECSELKAYSDKMFPFVPSGPPQQLVVFPENDISIENGSPAGFKVEVHDEFQNITTHSKLIVRCQLLGAPDLPVDTVDCSNTGTGVLLAKPVQLKNVTTEQVLTAKFGIPNQKGISCVERSLRVLPSTRVFRVEIYRQDSDDVMLIQNLERINWTAGDTLGSLRFRLYDEGGRLVPLTHKLAHNVKVNWTAGVRTAELAKGRLPNVSVPTKVQREHFYQVSFTDQQSVETSFFIIPRPDEPDKLRVTLRENTVKMGETLSENISVEVVDQYGNKTDTLNAENMKTVSVHADDLDVSTLSESSGTVLVSGVRFTGGSPGSRELCFKYQEFEEFARVKVTAGPPAKITLVEAPEMPLHVLNGRGLDTPFLLQLCDKWENPVPDQRVVIAIKTLSTQLKVSAKGEHELEFRGSFSRNSIPGPVVKLNVMPDPNNPVKLTVEYDNEAILIAGDFLPEFKVMVVSEEGGPVKNVNPASLTMLLWQGLAAGTRPPPEVIHICRDLNLLLLKWVKWVNLNLNGFVHFRQQILSAVNRIQTSFTSGNLFLLISSCQIALKVVHDKPVRLVPESSPATPVVSNSDAGNRTLLDSLCLKIMVSFLEVCIYLALRKADMERIQNAPRRKCTMPDPFKGSPDVLGKIAHLAQVEDDDAAKVISWHILGDMDCVVTVTTAAAKKIYDDTQGRQQVMPLETYALCMKIDWKVCSPLPHIRNEEPLFKPLGNPVFVRDLLIFPEHEENCNKVFSTVVGDTILVDDLDSANHYRKGVVQNKVQCPTLLTRQGERIRGNGKFGGLQNKAPPIEKLRGQVFGAPLPEEYHTISKQIELLQQYSVAVQKALEVRADFDGHMLYLKSPEMKQKQRELQDQEKTLKDIEKKLGGWVYGSVNLSPDETLPAKRIRRKKRILGTCLSSISS
uniref:Structural maintenance of chromosomes flexible hinge domain containing 1 n=1 Tax=Astyanax mexicanus TaxID=7994 RepID=A0A8B9H6L9_ASTMX